MDLLPNEILVEIFSRLMPKHLARLGRVCWHFHHMIQNIDIFARVKYMRPICDKIREIKHEIYGDISIRINIQRIPSCYAYAKTPILEMLFYGWNYEEPNILIFKDAICCKRATTKYTFHSTNTCTCSYPLDYLGMDRSI